MPTRNEKVRTQLAECQQQRYRLARIVDEARALCDEAVAVHAKAVQVFPRDQASKLALARAWVDARAAMDLLVEAGRTAARYDLELLLRGVDLADVL